VQIDSWPRMMMMMMMMMMMIRGWGPYVFMIICYTTENMFTHTERLHNNHLPLNRNLASPHSYPDPDQSPNWLQVTLAVKF
jgi:hypothetical protein